jgi:uncharacterized protein YdeI (YjbR/CyaY-like superfamily)
MDVVASSAEVWREWLSEHSASETEAWLVIHHKDSGVPSIRIHEAMEQALCFGWIDGVRHSLDDASYTNRFTPRKPTSNWSLINVAKVEELEQRGLMAPAGLRAYEARKPERTGVYSSERAQPAVLPSEFEERLRANSAATEWFEGRPPGYRKTAIHWVISAKREETRLRRLQQLIDCSAEGRNVPPLAR